MLRRSVSDLMVNAFVWARKQQSSTVKVWVGVSHRVGGLLPKSGLLVSVQRIGELDVLLRCMEDEAQANMGRIRESLWILHLQTMLSGIWVCELYEVFRLLKERELVARDDTFDSLENDLRALRITISKHEIAADNKLPGKSVLMKSKGATDAEAYEYRAKDPQRAHIMSMGLSVRGSVQWQAIDGTSVDSPRWLERRSLSERALQLWRDDG